MNHPEEMTVRQYLNYVYPLATADFAKKSDAELQMFFDNLDFYYKLNPQPQAVIPEGKYVPRNIHDMPKVGDLYSPAIINPDGFWCRNVYPPDKPLNNSVVNGFSSHSNVEIWHSNVYNGANGIYYYLMSGSGIYVNLGNTLVARNKLHALRKLGCNNAQIAQTMQRPTGYWPDYYKGELPPNSLLMYFQDLVDQYMKQHNCSQSQAENALIDAAIDETNYRYGRINDTGWQVDKENFLLGKQRYDTIQLTTQANMNNGWAFEIIDLRVQGDNLKENMGHLSQYYSIRNPLNLSQYQQLNNQWPYYNLYSTNTMSEITKYYKTYQDRFPFAGPGSYVSTPVPGCIRANASNR